MPFDGSESSASSAAFRSKTSIQIHEPANIDLWKRTEVDEQPDWMVCRAQVVDDLRLVSSIQFFDRLELDDDPSEAHKVWDVEAAVASPIHDMQFPLRFEGYAAIRKLGFKCVLVDLFEEAGAEGLVDSEDRTANGEGLVLEGKHVVHGGDYSILGVLVALSPRTFLRWKVGLLASDLTLSTEVWPI